MKTARTRLQREGQQATRRSPSTSMRSSASQAHGGSDRRELGPRRPERGTRRGPSPDQLPRRIQRKIRVGADGCWHWTGSENGKGYGKVWHDGRTCRAHRAVYELLVGAIPTGLQLHHDCENRRCVNPAHLIACTQSEHMAIDGRANKVCCINGHEYDESNTYRRTGRKGYECRACDADRKRRKRAAA